MSRIKLSFLICEHDSGSQAPERIANRLLHGSHVVTFHGFDDVPCDVTDLVGVFGQSVVISGKPVPQLVLYPLA